MSDDTSDFRFGEAGDPRSSNRFEVTCFRCKTMVPREDALFRLHARGHICSLCRAAERRKWIIRFLATAIVVLAVIARLISISLNAGKKHGD